MKKFGDWNQAIASREIMRFILRNYAEGHFKEDKSLINPLFVGVHTIDRLSAMYVKIAGGIGLFAVNKPVQTWFEGFLRKIFKNTPFNNASENIGEITYPPIMQKFINADSF